MSDDCYAPPIVDVGGTQTILCVIPGGPLITFENPAAK